jgi:hypothetical protein
MIDSVLKHIAAFRSRPSVRLLDVLYGPKALPLRTQVAAMLLDRKVTGKDPAAQYGHLRKLLIECLGVAGNSEAGEDAEFENKAGAMIAYMNETK